MRKTSFMVGSYIAVTILVTIIGHYSGEKVPAGEFAFIVCVASATAFIAGWCMRADEEFDKAMAQLRKEVKAVERRGVAKRCPASHNDDLAGRTIISAEGGDGSHYDGINHYRLVTDKFVIMAESLSAAVIRWNALRPAVEDFASVDIRKFLWVTFHGNMPIYQSVP